MNLLTAGLTATLMLSSLARAADEIHWTITGQTSVTFDWRGADSTISYGMTAAYGQSVTAVPPTPMPISSAGPFWEARISGLQENTLYHYSIGTGPDHTFRTPPARGASGFVVAAQGDIGETMSYRNMGLVQALIPQVPPAFVLMLGDLTYGNNHGQAHVDQHFNDVMAWSQDAAYMPAWGNHEWDKTGHCSGSTTTACDLGSDCPAGETCSGAGDDLRNYKGRFDFPANAQSSVGEPALGCCGEDWYWFDYGNVRFIAYPEPYTGAWLDWSTKAKAVMDAAQADPAITFIVTFGHRPAYSSGHHPGSPTLQRYLGALGAAHSKYVLNMNGHTHGYERTYPQSGVVHVTAGTGGASLEEDGSCLYLTCIQPAWSAFRAMHLGFLKLRFTASSIEGGFVCGPAGGGINDVSCSPGTIIDAFTIGTTPVADIQPPTVTMSAPGDGAVVSGTAAVTASASDNVGVAGVQFFLDGSSLGVEDTSAPYAVSWNTTGATNAAHALEASARDAAGNSATSSTITVSVSNAGSTPDTTLPTVGVSAPAAGAVVSGTVAVTASAADNVGVAGVAFKLDGAPLGAEVVSAPYSVLWNTLPSTVGSHRLTATARDAAGNSETSGIVTVAVRDQQAPTISITAPPPNTKVGADLTITASASDNVGVVGVAFFLDGLSVGLEDTSAPYTIKIKTDKLPHKTTHTLTAVARDAAGNTTTSAPVSIFKG